MHSLGEKAVDFKFNAECIPNWNFHGKNQFVN